MAGSAFTCDFTNSQIPPTVILRKTTTGVTGGPFSFTLTNTTQVWGVAVDASDNIYVSCLYENRIRKVTAATGLISTFAGSGPTGPGGYGGDGGPASLARLDYPLTVAAPSARRGV